jgi:hypothetical protein
VTKRRTRRTRKKEKESCGTKRKWCIGGEKRKGDGRDGGEAG